MFDFSDLHALADLTRQQAGRRPDGVAQVFEERTTTFRQLDRHASRIANGLVAFGVEPQARIGYMGLNSDRFFEVVYGCFKANAVLVGVNWRLAAPEIVYVLNDARAEVLFVGAEFLEVVEKIRGELRTVRHIVAIDGAHGSWPEFASWRDSQSDVDPMLGIAPDDDVLQLYTSGTTGHPKGVQLTNANYIAFFELAQKAGWADYEAGDSNLVAMPNFHVAGVNMGLVTTGQGARAVIMKQVEPRAVLDFLVRYQINNMFLVPAVIQFLLQVPGVESHDFSSLRHVFYGASPISEDVLLRATKLFNCSFTQLYGLTETVGAGTALDGPSHDPSLGKLRSCGRAYPGFEIRVLGAGGQALPPGEVGEIAIKSPTVMKGYWGNPDATATSIVDGWFLTGDAGYFDDDGYLFIHDRVKDMIVSGGENIYPAEVENALMSHPQVADAAVIGVPDKKWGEAVKACVVLETGATLGEGDIIAYCKTRIAAYKCPKSVDFLAALPRNPSGKILRRELREPYWAGLERRVN
ncbi:MAG TPA: long-chain-fatty-acid--CoA ligase [Candidatus Binatia bacterium]|jgi:acyl-CoA synthetase (AMP-forming)/AMP-acid ligase II